MLSSAIPQDIFSGVEGTDHEPTEEWWFGKVHIIPLQVPSFSLAKWYFEGIRRKICETIDLENCKAEGLNGCLI